MGEGQGIVLAGYCVAIALASLTGGWIPLWLRLSHTGIQVAMSFIGGAMLGVGLLHLLPHAFYATGDILTTAGWLVGGFLLMFFIERVFHFHHHDSTLGEGHHHAPHESHDHGPPSHEAGSRSVTWKAALAGLTLHSALDGVALAASVLAERSTAGAWPGLAVFLVICLHKPFDSLTLGTLLAVDDHAPRLRHLVNLAYALAVPAGVVLFSLGLDVSPEKTGGIVGSALALAAGAFVCIATSDLLPELQFHSHDRLKLSAALLLGLGLAAGLVAIEHARHDHGHVSGASVHLEAVDDHDDPAETSAAGKHSSAHPD